MFLNGGEDPYDAEEFIMEADEEEIEIILNDFIKKSNNTYFSNKAFGSIFNPIINRMFKEKRYSDILENIRNYDDSKLVESNILFEIAYSYFKLQNLPASKKYYELYIEKCGETNAVLNNLGLIFENTGDLLKAKEYYQKAAIHDSGDDTCRRNLVRVEDELKNKSKVEYELQAAIERYRSESPYVHRKVLEFYNKRNKDGFILCSYRQAPQFLKMTGTRAADFLKDILSKRYFLKIQDHKYETQSSVYRLNPY